MNMWTKSKPLRTKKGHFRYHDAKVSTIASILRKKGYDPQRNKYTHYSPRSRTLHSREPDLIAVKHEEVLNIEYESLGPLVRKLKVWNDRREAINATKIILVIPDLLQYADEIWILKNKTLRG